MQGPDMAQAAAASRLISGAHYAVIVSPDRPSADSISSDLALKLSFETMHKTVLWIGTGERAQSFDFIAGNDSLQSPKAVDSLRDKIDMVVFAAADTINAYQGVLDERPWLRAQKPTLWFDNHRLPDNFRPTGSLVNPMACATAEVLLDICLSWRWEITPDIAKLLMLGVVAGTENFTNNQTDEPARTAADRLTQRGADRTASAKLLGYSG